MRPAHFSLPDGLSLRPARDSDKPFIESLYRAIRNDLRLIDAEDDFIEELIEQQHHAQTVGYGDKFPNAYYFIIEKQRESIGRVVVDFGHNEVRVVDIALIPLAQGKGYGVQVLRALQEAARQVRTALTLSVYRDNIRAVNLYRQMGFQVAESSDVADLMVWYPAPN